MASGFASWLKNTKSTGSYYNFFLPAVFLLCLALLVGTILVGTTEKSLIRGMDAIRGPKYTKAIIENQQPTLSPQPSPQSRPPMQHEPFPPPQLQPQPQLHPSLRQPSPQLQPQVQYEPFPQPPPQQEVQLRPSPQNQLELQTRPELQYQPYPQPQLQLQPQPQLHSSPRQPSPQLQPQVQYEPFPQPPPQRQVQLRPSPQNQLELQTRPELQYQPYPQPQLQLQTQPQQSPQHQPELQTQPQPSPQLQHQTQMQQETPPQQSPQHQPELQTRLQPSPQLQHQTQMQQEMSPQLQLQPEDQKSLSQSRCRPPGSDPLPEGLVSNTADLQMQPLWGTHKQINSSTSLFTAAVGIKQRDTVDKMVRKFLSCNFNVMLFHYDGIVDAWKDLDWEPSVVHISAVNQTKWWFAKRFLHPDIVADYSHIFLWDEDLGVENFDPDRYLSIVKEEGLEISQPALDVEKSEVHHAITARWTNSTVHRRAKSSSHSKACDLETKDPPCTGWVELMAPVFSKNAWRCMWYMIQKDLNHAWGLDILFGYCAQGDRTKNVGVVDAEYVVHYGFPTFGGEPHHTGNANSSERDPRTEVRRHSFREYKVFRRRWEIAAIEDESWVDPYPGSLNISMI